MLILSTFNSDYLQKPLQFLIDILNKSNDLIQIEYVESELSTHLSSLKINKKKPEICIILLRIKDLIKDNDRNINIEQLNKNIDFILQNLEELKKEKNMSLILSLCPSVTSSLSKEFQKFEEKIKQEMERNKIHLITYEEIDKKIPDENFINSSGEENHIPYTPKFYCEMANLLILKLYSLKPKPYKIIIVDCDNTLWGGLVGEVSWENIELKRQHLNFQQFLIDQFKQGKLIVLASKNYKKNVMEVFHNRKDMLLKEEHLVIELNEVNWDLKNNNIKKILKASNITPDHALFIDDSEEEREAVEKDEKLLGIDCIDPWQDNEKLNTDLRLTTNKYLEVTVTDKNRTALLREQIASTSKVQAENKDLHKNDNEKYKEKIKKEIEKYHNNLEIIKVTKVNVKEIERISSLSFNTNQFNIYRKPKSEEEITKFLSDEKNFAFLGRKKQSLTSVQEIGSVVLLATIGEQNLSIQVLLASCRVLARKMGDIIPLIKEVGKIAFKNNLSIVSLIYKKTDKNLKMCIFLNTLIEAGLSKSNELIDFNKCSEIKIDFFSEKLKELDIVKLAYTEFSNETYFEFPELKKTTIENIQDIRNRRIELEKIIYSDYLLNKFFSGDEFQKIKLLSSLENKIVAICNLSLGKEGCDKSLVARGLDSLEATILRFRIFESVGISIPISKLLCQSMTVYKLIEYIEQLGIPTVSITQSENFYNLALPVSFQQQRICIAEQQESAGNSSNYHMLACYQYKLSENLDSEKFEKDFKNACHELIKYYDVFGTVFKIKKNELTQEISSPENRMLYFEIKNLRNERFLEQAIQEEINVPWTMTDKSLFRITVFKGQVEKNYYILFHVHHAIFDAISLGNCLNTLTEIYEKITKNPLKSIIFPPQYIDFISDQQKKLKDQTYQLAAFNFWQDKFSQIQNPTSLPTDLYLPIFKPVSELIAKRYEFSLAPKEVLALKTLVKSVGVTCFSAINALFALLIASYTYQKNVITITALNGRNGHPSYDKMVGFFINLLVQQFDLDKKLQLDEYLKAGHENFLASQEFQEFSFEKNQKISRQKNNGNNLFNPALIYQSYAESTLKLNGKKAELVFPKESILDLRGTCRFGNLTLFAQERQDKLNFVIEYASELFSFTFIQRFAKNFLHTITSACNNSKQSLQNISVVCDEEREQLIELGQGPKLNLAQEISLVDRFQKIVRQYSENIALCCGQERLSFNEVDQQSTNLAHALIDSGVKCGNYVGIFLDENYLFFIAELAILKIGAVFIPLSKENPNERLQLIIDDAKINFFIVDDNHQGLFDTNAQKYQFISIKMANNTINLDRELPKLDKKSDEFCVLYTSGSTGTPKGVILQEKGIFRVVESPNFMEILPGDNMAQTANQAFDAAQLECWLAWNHGANLVLFNKETILNIGLFRNKLKSDNITHMWLTAGLFDSHANNQPDLFKDLKYLMVGGDVVHKDTILKVLNFEEAPIIINGYGPTEASIFTLTHTFNKQTINDHNSTLIGLPINETEVEIITALGSKTPLGGIGELVVKGWGVAKGYLNASELLDKQFARVPGKSKYQTNDLVKYTSKDPQIMFMGRTDKKQIKINGNLVALEEIRHCLSLHSDIKQVEILVTKIGNVNKLVAFYTSNSMNKKNIESTNKMFHSLLSKSLPAYMFPSFYIQLDDFKINANGKLDKTQFQKFESKLNEYLIEEIFPRTQNEKAILKIVKNRLYAFPNNIKTNLITFGCDSIATMEIINAINIKFKPEFEKRFKSEFEKNADVENVKFDNYLNEKNFHANDLYRNPTIEGLADVLIMKLNHETKKKSLRICKEGDSNLPPIIFIHPAGGGLSCFEKLIEQVKFDNICYGIEDPLLDSNQLKLLTMEQMAQNYLSVINNQIQGPFILAGYSFGGMLALEIAAQYESVSENAYLLEVFLFDTWVVSCANEKIKIKLKHDVLIYCAEQRKQANVNDGSHEMISLLEKLCEHHQTIGFEFKPKQLISIPVFLFKATVLNDEFAKLNMQDKSNFLLNFLDEKLFNIQEIKGTHFDLLKSDLIAKCLTQIMNEKNLKKFPNNYEKKINNGGRSTLFSPLLEIDNDPKFSCSFKPK